MRILGVMAVYLVGISAAGSSIASSEVRLQLKYEGPVGCPGREDFVEQLLGRSKYLDAMARARLDVTVSAGGSGYVAKLDLLDADGNRVEREVAGPSCSDVTAAIALVAAVAIDGSSVLPTTAPTSAPVPREVAAKQSAEQVAAVSTTVAAVSTNGESTRDAIKTPKTQETKQRRPLGNFSVGVVGGIHRSIAPSSAPTVGLSASYHPQANWGSPEYRIEGLVGWSDPIDVAYNHRILGTAEFLWLATRSAACPLALATVTVRLASCALLEIGVLRGTGTGSTWGPESRYDWWLAPGALLDWSATLASLRLRLAAGIVRPLVRPQYKFRPEPDVFRPPFLGLVAEVGLGWTF